VTGGAAILSGRRFRFRPVLTVFAALGLLATVSLGAWQLARLDWKLDLIGKVEARVGAPPAPFADVMARARKGEDMEYAPVRLRGAFAQAPAARLFGAYEGAPGHYLFMPFKTDEGAAVYVNMGFTPQFADPDDVAVPPAGSPATVEGLFRAAETPRPPAAWFVSRQQSADGLWFIRDPRIFAAPSQRPASPYYVDRFAVDGAPWPRGGTTRLSFSNRHLEYALTWFGLAATLFGVWLAFSLEPAARPARSSAPSA